MLVLLSLALCAAYPPEPPHCRPCHRKFTFHRHLQCLLLSQRSEHLRSRGLPSYLATVREARGHNHIMHHNFFPTTIIQWYKLVFSPVQPAIRNPEMAPLVRCRTLIQPAHVAASRPVQMAGRPSSCSHWHLADCPAEAGRRARRSKRACAWRPRSRRRAGGGYRPRRE